MMIGDRASFVCVSNDRISRRNKAILAPLGVTPVALFGSPIAVERRLKLAFGHVARQRPIQAGTFEPS